jgi:hemerythrin superfamily protein
MNMAESTKHVTPPDSRRADSRPAEARPHGFHGAAGVFETLIAQHEQLTALLERVKSARSPEERSETWTEVRRQLLSHERAEELEIYAALEGHAAARDMLDEHSRETRELEFSISELELIDSASDEWMAHVLEVAALFEEHARGEEETFFPAAQQLLGEPAARELEERFAGAQREIIDTLA